MIDIQCFGSVNITVQTPNGPRTIELQDVALVPSFHTNMVSLERFRSKNIHFDSGLNVLKLNGETLCNVQSKLGFWILECDEYQPSLSPPTTSPSPSPLRRLFKPWTRG